MRHGVTGVIVSELSVRKAPAVSRSGWTEQSRHIWLLYIGIAALAGPALVALARDLWSTEDGAHGPIVLVTGLWLLFSSRGMILAVARPGDPRLAFFLFFGSLFAYILARTTSMLGPECLAILGVLAAIFYYHAGLEAVKRAWFPAFYLLFMLPMPETITLPLTHVLKLKLSVVAVALLSKLGFAVGNGGVVIFVDQYELLVESACSGLNSLIGLSAIGVFYAYVHYQGRLRDCWPLLLGIIPIAIIANFVRVIVMVLAMHYGGDRFVKLYVHGAAGVLLFLIAMLLFVGLDRLVQSLRPSHVPA